MPMYVQTIQDGTPTTTHLETYLNRSSASDAAKLDLVSRGQALEYEIAIQPPPAAVDPAHLCATGEPTLMYQQNGLHIQAKAYLRAAPPVPVEPVAPTEPQPPPASCTPAQQSAYDSAKASYDADMVAYTAAKAMYDSELASYTALLARRAELAAETAAYNDDIAELAAQTGASGGTSPRLAALANGLNEQQHQKLPYGQLVKALEAADHEIVAISTSWSTIAAEADFAGTIAIRELLELFYDRLFMQARDAAP